ncbi:MAG: hypothetical protein JRD05_00660 [Deltaproteobacteria bacterium]|nr:hypothetical protein [Deltaproteobacteria bacterium]
MKEISWELREQAEELYILDGKTHEEIAGITGIAVQTLKGWSADEGWTEKRREYRQQIADIRRDTVRLRSGLLKQALNSLNPQHVYAFTNIEQMAVKAAREEIPAAPLAVDPKTIKTPEDAIDALQDLIENKLNAMLTMPGAISLAKIKEIKQAQELIDKMKKKYKPETREKESATEEDKQRLIDEVDRILGVR